MFCIFSMGTNGTMKSLEASMIIRNEAEMLPTALDSMEGIDSITICDTGSSDKTFDIYKQYQKTFPLKWFKYSRFNAETHIDDFSHARNECKQECKGDWLFILDGDEVCQFDIGKVQKMINSQWIKDINVLLIDVQTDIETTPQPRVFRNRQDMWYFGAAHNTLRYFPDGKEGKAIKFQQSKYYKTTLKIRAYTSPNHEREPDRTLKILTDQLQKNPYNDRYIYYLVREWLNRREPIKALFYLDKYFRIAPPSNEKADAYYLAATCHADMGDFGMAGEFALKAVGTLPSLRNAWKLLEALSHPDYKEYWAVMVKKADNKGVMFIRD